MSRPEKILSKEAGDKIIDALYWSDNFEFKLRDSLPSGELNTSSYMTHAFLDKKSGAGVLIRRNEFPHGESGWYKMHFFVKMSKYFYPKSKMCSLETFLDVCSDEVAEDILYNLNLFVENK